MFRVSRDALCGLSLISMLSSACSVSDRSEAADASAKDGTPSTPDAHERALFPSQIPADFHCDPTLDSIRAGIFVTSCGWDACHGNNNAAFGLYLVENVRTVYDGLVNVKSGSCPDWVLVTPGDPDNSFLWNKITQDQPACGERMPRGVEPLPQAALDCVRGWIEQLSAVVSDAGEAADGADR